MGQPHPKFTNADRGETLELLKKLQHCPGPRLRDRLVRLNIGLVKKEVSYWLRQGADSYEDLLQVGALGLMAAIDRFEPERGYAFSSFAVRHIRGEILHYLRDRSTTLRIPRRWRELNLQAMKVTQDLRATLHREPTQREIAHALGVSPKEWQEARLAYQNRCLMSLDAPVQSHEESSASIGDLIADPKATPWQKVEETWHLQEAIAQLEQRTRQILEYVYLEDLPQRDVAEMMGLSVVTVSRQVKKGITTLRAAMMAQAS
jgi:RNA polymerase sigma-B factor